MECKYVIYFVPRITLSHYCFINSSVENFEGPNLCFIANIKIKKELFWSSTKSKISSPHLKLSINRLVWVYHTFTISYFCFICMLILLTSFEVLDSDIGFCSVNVPVDSSKCYIIYYFTWCTQYIWMNKKYEISKLSLLKVR